MPLIRVDLRRGKSADYKKAIVDGVYRALRETFNVPDEDRFFVVSEHDADSMVFSRNYMNIQRTAECVFRQFFVSNTRDLTQKKALFARVVQLLKENPGVRTQDVFINMVDMGKENWSFGDGIAQYTLT